jgi:hypothetical protein
MGAPVIAEGPSIAMLPWRFDVGPLRDQLARNPNIWNEHRERTATEGTPHLEVSDIWVRYGDTPDACARPHESHWYPCVAKIPAAWSLSRRMMLRVGGKRLGGVLITKVPAGGEVKPHIDRGWHAEFYEKFAIQIAGNKEQAFQFEGESLSAETGQSYTFRNDRMHWVTNPSAEDRMTLIVCIRR